MTPEQLFEYAIQHARQAEADGKGTQYPTFQDVAKRFRVNHEAIEQACDDFDQANGYMKPAVGVRCGSAVGVFEHKGQWLVEAYS
jgi:hypothetical protein